MLITFGIGKVGNNGKYTGEATEERTTCNLNELSVMCPKTGVIRPL